MNYGRSEDLSGFSDIYFYQKLCCFQQCSVNVRGASPFAVNTHRYIAYINIKTLVKHTLF